MAVVATAVRSRSIPIFGSRLREQQLEVLDQIVKKHLEGPGFESERQIASCTEEFALTTNERPNGLLHWEHGHLVAALDTLNSYQRDRRAKSGMHMAGHRMGMQRTYKNDPRTRFVELMKRWLSTNAAATNVTEDEVRRMSGLCREIMIHPLLFPARNERSFLKTIAEVYTHLDVQLRELLERDRTCAELAQRVLSLSRNLVSDAIAYLLVGPTDLKKTDELPSLEVVSLWASLPSDSHPLPGRIDPKMQRAMRDVWKTATGSLIASLLQTRWCVRLFEGAGARAQEAAAATTPRSTRALDRSALIEELKTQWGGTSMKQSGLAGSFRKPEEPRVRQDYIAAVEALVDIMYLVGEALVLFQQISDGLGDYGTLRVANWLHPFLGALSDKVVKLKSYLESLKRAVDDQIVTASARGYHVEKPTPSQRMGERALRTIDRAVIHSGSHIHELLKAVEDLRQRSCPDRLPQVVAEIGGACMQLDTVLSSADMQACVGDIFPNLSRVAEIESWQPQNRIGLDIYSQPQVLDVTGSERTLATINLRAAAGAICDCPEVDVGRLAPEVSFADRSAFDLSPRVSIAGDLTPRLPSATCTEERPSSGFAYAVPTAEVPPRSPKGSQRQAHWPLHVHRKGSEQGGGSEISITLEANVMRLMPAYCGPGFCRHDRRALRLCEGKLDVYEKGSVVKVKSSIRMMHDVEECSLLPGGKRLSLVIRRVPKGADVDSGVWNNKNYVFEFTTQETATAFHNEISRFLSA